MADGRHIIVAVRRISRVSAARHLTDLGPIWLVVTPDRGVVYRAAAPWEDRLGIMLAVVTYRAAIAACGMAGRN